MKKVAIQGIKGSFHDIAAHQFFANEEIELICCETFEELFDTMKKDSSLLAMMAIENTIAGSLLHNYELLRASNLTIVGEHKLHIEHSLLCLPDEDINDIREINSHPVAIMQCRDFLKQFRNCKIVEADDTAGAAEAISRLGLKGHAAICSKFAAPIYHMKVLREAIEDNKHNFTRFLCLCDPWNADAIRRTRQINKSSIVFSGPHEKGELSHVLSVLSFYDINMTKIQSLPIIGHEWEYLFYVDITFADYSRYRQCIEAIRPLTRQSSILGEYESDPH